jgi:hypothetical protein
MWGIPPTYPQYIAKFLRNTDGHRSQPKPLTRRAACATLQCNISWKTPNMPQVHIRQGDPREAGALALLQASHALMESLFPPEDNHYLSV